MAGLARAGWARGPDRRRSRCRTRPIAGLRWPRDVRSPIRRAGAGDGRLSKADAGQLLDAVKDGDSYTDIEKDSVKYIRENFKWTDAADEWFRGEIRSWAATK